jgi:long-chain acyl-CoA synthetase
MNIAKNLERSAFYFPDRPSLSQDLSETSYAQLNTCANQVATALIHMGVRPGDHIALCAPNSIDWLAFYFGILKAGGVAVSLSSQLKGDELEFQIKHSRSKLVFTFDEKLNDLSRFRGAGWLEKVISPQGDLDFKDLLNMGSGSFTAIERDPSDTALIIYTSGSLGRPKGVMITHENVNTAIQNIMFYEQSSAKDRTLLFLPFNHAFGQVHIMNGTILSAGCLELMSSVDLERILELMACGRLTKLFAVSTVYVRLLAEERLKEKMGALRFCMSSGGATPPEVIRQWEERTGQLLYEAYGSTETQVITFNHYYKRVMGSVGTPVFGAEIQIRDENGNQVGQGERGEICIRGRQIMKGYLDDPENTEAAFWDGGWFRSGDVGVFDNEGYLYIVDRVKEVIITGGENVYPKEVEDVLYTWPDVLECTVIGLPDPEWGERVTAVITPQPGKSIDPKELRDYLKPRLSSFKVPREYRIVKDLAKGPAGKILKRELREAILKESKKEG